MSEEFVKKKVTIYTDGSCLSNPGPGGWGALLMWDGYEKELQGSDALTTNNRMELMAPICALETLIRPCVVELYTDSLYVQKGITLWLKGWKARGWKGSNKREIKNKDLWMRLDQASLRHDTTWYWVRGHAGCEGNERADVLARSAAEKTSSR